MRCRATQWTSKTLSGSAVFNGPVTETYGYDPVDQLIEADYGTGKLEGFQYDPVGNREQVELTESGSTTTTSYTANVLNQYTTVGSDVPTYDARGNLTSQNGWTYTYDSKNRLLSATDGTTTASFVYDYRNRQVSRTIDGETTYFVWDDWSLLENRDDRYAVMAQYVHGPAIDEILVKITTAGSHHYHRDGLQSAVALTDAAGAVAETYAYGAFGEIEIRDALGTMLSVSQVGNPFTYTGREWVSEIGLMNYRNRIYSAELGRFLQTDPIRLSGGEISLYLYTRNSPITRLDSYGLEWVESNHEFMNGSTWVRVAFQLIGQSAGSSGAIVSGATWMAQARVTVTCTCSITGETKSATGARRYNGTTTLETEQNFPVQTNDPMPLSVPSAKSVVGGIGELLAEGAKQTLPNVSKGRSSNFNMLEREMDHDLPTSPSAGSWKHGSPCN